VNPQKYTNRPGQGSAYSYIDCVDLSNECIKITILSPEASRTKNEIVIRDSEIIAILPNLLNGDISCFDALQSLEVFLRNKHKEILGSSDSTTLFNTHFQTKIRLGYLMHNLLGKEDFATLCQFFPHTPEDKVKNIYDTPVKVVSDGIISSIKERFNSGFTSKINNLS